MRAEEVFFFFLGRLKMVWDKKKIVRGILFFPGRLKMCGTIINGFRSGEIARRRVGAFLILKYYRLLVAES